MSPPYKDFHGNDTVGEAGTQSAVPALVPRIGVPYGEGAIVYLNRAKHTTVIHHSLLVLSSTGSSYTRRGHVPALQLLSVIFAVGE